VILTCDAVLFDMDGTIIDSAGAVIRQWERWAGRRGIDLDAITAVSHGRRTIETMRLLMPGEDLNSDLAEFVAGEAADLLDVSAMRGAAELASQLPPERWAIVTSSSRAVAEARLAFAGFPTPGVLVTADDVTHGKPHPEPWLRAAEALAVSPQELRRIRRRECRDSGGPCGGDARRGCRVVARDAGMRRDYRGIRGGAGQFPGPSVSRTARLKAATRLVVDAIPFQAMSNAVP
jgi:phosphoglycolate phosphatase-like HAD superfamily hydrolase